MTTNMYIFLFHDIFVHRISLDYSLYLPYVQTHYLMLQIIFVISTVGYKSNMF